MEFGASLSEEQEREPSKGGTNTSRGWMALETPIDSEVVLLDKWCWKNVGECLNGELGGFGGV